MVICLERGADLHMAQLMPLSLTVSCFSKIQIGFTFLVPVHPGSPRKRAAKRVCVCVCVLYCSLVSQSVVDTLSGEGGGAGVVDVRLHVGTARRWSAGVCPRRRQQQVLHAADRGAGHRRPQQHPGTHHSTTSGINLF